MGLFEKEENITHNAKSYTGIYSMHKYWAKKPYNIIRDFILKYSTKGEIILDPFCGSGVTITESIFTGRKVIGIDINPSAIFITKETVAKVSTRKLIEEYNKLETDCKDKINNLYVVKRADKQFIGTHFLWEGERLKEIWYKNGNGGGRNSRVIDVPIEEDVRLAQSISYERIPYYYPKGKLFHNSRINSNGSKYIYELFTPRNLYALSFLLDRIEKIDDEDTRNLLKFCFTSCVGQASRMVFVVKERGKFNGQKRKVERKEVGSWIIGYWVPAENFEINVWNCFENRYRKIIIAKRQQEQKEYYMQEALNFEELANTEQNLLLLCTSSTEALKNIPDNSIDYVLTDPPHGNRIPYLEQSMMWNEWLKQQVDYENEIVISESKERSKNIANYYFLLNEVLKDIERTLKPNRYFSLIFNSLDDDIWIKLWETMNKSNFHLEKVETLGYSANSIVQDNREGGLKTDFILTFKKNPVKVRRNIELLTLEQEENLLKQKIDECINKSNNGLQIFEILNYLSIEFLKKKKFFKLSDVLTVIRNNYIKKNNRWRRKEIVEHEPSKGI